MLVEFVQGALGGDGDVGRLVGQSSSGGGGHGGGSGRFFYGGSGGEGGGEGAEGV